jgi:hydrogenase maturation protease
VIAPLLVFGWGNRSRGDDALGPLFVEQLAALMATAEARGEIEFIDDYQLQPEHALDLLGRQRVLFVDASLDCSAPFEVSAVHASPAPAAVTTHALSPQALLQVYRRVHQADAPACTLLAIRGAAFELGAAPGHAALAHLRAALDWARGWVAAGCAAAQASSGTISMAPQGHSATQMPQPLQ